MGAVRYVSRDEWGAMPRRAATLQPSGAVDALYIHYTASHADRVPDTLEGQKERVRGVQRYHMISKGWSDIGYNFLGSRTGNIFVGRGNGVVPASQLGHNHNGRSYCFLGADMDGRDDVTDAGRLAMGKWVRDQFKQLGRLVPVKPHSAVYPTACPGDEIRAWISTKGWLRRPRKPSERCRPKWFFRFAAWWLGEGDWKHVGPRHKPTRPSDVPERIPLCVWKELAAFVAARKVND